jgi:hypothetical protein
MGRGGEAPLHHSLSSKVRNQGPVSLSLMTGESRVRASQLATDRRARSKVRARVVGSSLMSWVQALEDWWASVEAVVEDVPQQFKDIR